MRTLNNPFVTNGYFGQKYFCDREKETTELIQKITNGNNLALISTRRMGKTGLIEHCFEQPELKNSYITFFVDIYATSNLKEFVYLLGKIIFDKLKPQGNKIIEQFFLLISSLRPALKLDNTTGEPIFDIGLGEIKEPAITLEQIFKFLENADKPCIVAIDEFQQIARYPEKNTEALLRTYIQHCKNSRFIFAGSQSHMMEAIFFSAARPFYQSVHYIPLKAIELNKYTSFVENHFREGNKEISTELIEKIYALFDGHTWYMQTIFNTLFAHLNYNERVTSKLTEDAIEHIINNFEPIFQVTLNLISERQKELLFAIAKMGKTKAITSSQFVQKNGLVSAASVQTSAKQLIDKQIITQENKTYTVYDRFFGLWLAREYGGGYKLDL